MQMCGLPIKLQLETQKINNAIIAKSNMMNQNHNKNITRNHIFNLPTTQQKREPPNMKHNKTTPQQTTAVLGNEQDENKTNKSNTSNNKMC